MKKFKLKKKNLYVNVVLIFILILALALTLTSSFYMKKVSDKYFLSSNYPVIKTDSNIKRSHKIDDYIKKLDKNSLVDEININKDIVSLLILTDGRYESIIFDYESGDIINYEDLIISKYKQDFVD